jgi:pimeloyl-ACP methyl ester carboxylesterase
MRPIVKLLRVLAVPLLVVTACSGGPATPSTGVGIESVGVPITPTPSAVTVASATAIASATAASPSADPATSPSIEANFAVGDDARQLALVCWGEGSPTVLLETGGANIEEWSGSGVVRQLAGGTRVCTYDRAGTGASDPPPYERRDADDVVNDLKALFVAADLDGPYVLVGRSFGGMIVTHYAETRPEDVVGVVVLDTPAPSATFTEQTEPELVWDYPGNTERLDVVGGFENRFAKDPPKFEIPLLVITPVPGESSADDQSFWLQVSAGSRQVAPSCSDSAGGPCADAVVEFVNGLR